MQGGAWWHTPVTPEFGELRGEDCEFEARLDYSTDSLMPGWSIY
jgi:hypothetical protein